MSVSQTELLSNLTDLILKTKDKVQKNTLRQQHKELSKLIEEVLNKEIAEDTAAYEKLTKTINLANTNIETAIKDNEKIVATINTITSLISVAKQFV